MPLWKLTPVDLTDPNWEASTHKGTVIVRAPSEAAAREAAEAAFGVKTRFAPGRGVKAPPWKRERIVRAEKITDSKYATEGPTELLEPSFRFG